MAGKLTEIERDLREALSDLTQLEMAARGMIPVSKAMAEAHEAYTKLCGDRENIRDLLDELSRLREALEPFGRNAGASSLAKVYAHLTREHAQIAHALSEREGQDG